MAFTGSIQTAPYSQEWRNRRFHEFILAGVNAFLDTDFSEEDMDLIYTYIFLFTGGRERPFPAL